MRNDFTKARIETGTPDSIEGNMANVILQISVFWGSPIV